MTSSASPPSDRVRVGQRGAERGVFARVALAKGSVILRLARSVVPAPSRYTLQLDGEQHLASSGDADDFLNHACEPNARVAYDDMTVRARRDLAGGDEVTINYCATEAALAEPFPCACGSEFCYGVVRGHDALDEAQRARIRAYSSDFLASRRGGRSRAGT